MPVYKLTDQLIFPHPSYSDKDGLLAIGGDLSPERLILAYQNGIFPWFDIESPILWWSPDPRFVLFPEKIKVSKSLKKELKDNRYKVTYNLDFESVIANCKKIKRKDQNGTWITDEMLLAYTKLNKIGLAHSVEVWFNESLVGGLYGVAIGKCFFGESMFSKRSNASKIGFVHLIQKLIELNFVMIDCQVYTPHLESLGAESVKRDYFIGILETSLGKEKLEKVSL